MWRTIATITTFVLLTLMCAIDAHAQTGQRGFSVVLVLGDTQGATGAESASPPTAVRKALTDVKDFLPYKATVSGLQPVGRRFEGAPAVRTGWTTRYACPR
jgi:hypothetical protein